MKVTSGGSDSTVSRDCLTKRSGPFVRFFTDWVLVPKPEHQPVDIWVEWVVVEDFDIQVPRLEIVGRHKRDARREVAGNLSWQFSQLTRTEPRFARGGRDGVWPRAGHGPALWQALGRACADRHRKENTYFCQLFSEPPLRKVGTHGEISE